MRINRDQTSDVGLFVGNVGTIRNFGLRKVQVEGNFLATGLVANNNGRLMNVYVDGGRVRGQNNYTSLLVGQNQSRGLIINSYVRGAVVSGGLRVGGICGENQGRIINSYADANVSARNLFSGSLAGVNSGSPQVVNSYAAGVVSNTSNDRTNGGLLGGSYNSSNVRNSYSFATVKSLRGGGLIGESTVSVDNSYWDTEMSGKSTSSGGSGRTTEQLQMPVSNMGIYANWSNDDWYFGDEKSYPALRYARGDDSDNPACDSDLTTPLPSCGTLLPGQTDLKSLTFEINGEVLDNVRVFRDQPFSTMVFDYDIKMLPTTELQLRLNTFISTTMNSVFREADAQNTDYFSGKRRGDLSDPIMLQADTTEILTIIVGDVTYTLNIEVGSEDSVNIMRFNSTPRAGSTVNEGQPVSLAVEFADGTGNYDYSLQLGDTILDQGQGANATFNVVIPSDFVAADQTMQKYRLYDNGGRWV